MIGSLICITASRPDIMFATCLCVCFQAKPTELHVNVVKYIFRYLKETIHLSLWYAKEHGFGLMVFSDADRARCNLDRKKVRKVVFSFWETS